jgi:hypothetical protein
MLFHALSCCSFTLYLVASSHASHAFRQAPASVDVSRDTRGVQSRRAQLRVQLHDVRRVRVRRVWRGRQRSNCMDAATERCCICRCRCVTDISICVSAVLSNAQVFAATAACGGTADASQWCSGDVGTAGLMRDRWAFHQRRIVNSTWCLPLVAPAAVPCEDAQAGTVPGSSKSLALPVAVETLKSEGNAAFLSSNFTVAST